MVGGGGQQERYRPAHDRDAVVEIVRDKDASDQEYDHPVSHLSGYSDREIMKMGRWRSATFMEYISEQLDSFTKGMSTNMRRRFNFVNVEGAVLRDITKDCINSSDI